MVLEREVTDTRSRVALWMRWTIGVLAAIIGPSVAMGVTALGHCSAFGGRCPADPQPLLQDDVFGMVTTALAITTVVVGLCLRPDRTGAVASVVAAVPIGLLTGLAAAAYARG